MSQKIIDLIEKGRAFLITSHVRLDGDALGSELALCEMLRSLGKTALVYNEDPVPSQYRFLPGSDRIVTELPPLGGYDAVFVLDCSDLDRVGEQAAAIASASRIVNIDHHVSNGGFTDITYIDPEASSTGELVYRLLERMGQRVSKDMATNLYTAILTDTGGFHYGNTSKESLITAGNLVDRGADPQWISENVYDNYPLAKFKLLTLVLDTLQIDLDGKVASMVVSLEFLDKTSALSEHTDGFVDFPRTIHGVEVSILYSELSDRFFKVSLRSKGKLNVESLARFYGGGGHVNAAACRIEGELADIRRQVLDFVRDKVLAT
ncbi:MAG: bifunctional oligoribonuclease/PAP phosphatase NrnA [Deltaproteobacteria bacterium]|nr:bifunctional oligoribonuclease/PAP phosphatase NrnA [Deltaproteobacteria bacterium]